MVVTIQQVLRPLLITSFIMGLGTYPMEQPNLRIRWIKYLSISYCLTIWFFYAYLLYYALTFFMCKIICEEIIYESILVINTFTAITSAIMSFYHQKKFEISLRKISIVDDSLEELDAPKTYQKTYTCSKLVVMAWIVYTVINNFTDAIWFAKLKETYSWKLFLSCIINHSININAYGDLLFIFLLWYVGTRFDKVNERMRCLLVREDHGLRCTWKKSVIALHRYTLCTDYKQTLWTSMHLHLELCRIVRELNFIFGTQIILGMAIYLIYLTSMCYGLCMILMQELSKEILQTPIVWFMVIFGCFVLLIRVFAVNYICQSVMDKANKIDKIIHQLTNTHRYANMYPEVYQFTLQVMHRPLKLNGLNLFYLGNECLRKVCFCICLLLPLFFKPKITKIYRKLILYIIYIEIVIIFIFISLSMYSVIVSIFQLCLTVVTYVIIMAQMKMNIPGT